MTLSFPSARATAHSPSILQALEACRDQTLALFSTMQPAVFRQQSHPDFSPAGWHLGHIAYTESMWLLAAKPNLEPDVVATLSTYQHQYEKLFAADGLPKSERQNLPELAEILTYLATVRAAVRSALTPVTTLREGGASPTHLEHNAPKNTPKNTRLWHWLLQHEAQHLETIALVLAMHHLQGKVTPLFSTSPVSSSEFSPSQLSTVSAPILQLAAPKTSHAPKNLDASASASPSEPDMTLVAAGDFIQGSNAIEAIDNERPAHPVTLEHYWIDRTPVTCGAYRHFIAAGGYHNKQYWSPAGWRWQQQAQVTEPLYWSKDPAFNTYPVFGVSWYEADAYARFVGKRLPSESEWEKAASTGAIPPQSIGRVWEWTQSWFTGYEGFTPFPYAGYSQLYFDGQHKVLRGSSWATLAYTRRRSFRNWYHPHRREMFAGFRCATSSL